MPQNPQGCAECRWIVVVAGEMHKTALSAQLSKPSGPRPRYTYPSTSDARYSSSPLSLMLHTSS